MSVQELAAKAAAEIHRRGWQQGGYGTPKDEGNGPVCLIGGVYAAGCGSPYGSNDESDELARYIEAKLGVSGEAWNDAKGRTAGDVLALLDAIAAGQ